MKTLFALVSGLIASFFIGAFALLVITAVGDKLGSVYSLDYKWYLLISVGIGSLLIYCNAWFSHNYIEREPKPEAKSPLELFLDRFKW